MSSSAVQTHAPEPFPGHDPGVFTPVPCQIVASWPVGHFAENLAVTADGAVLVSLHSHQRIDRYYPATGEVGTWTTLPAPVAGLAMDAAGTVWATGGELGRAPGLIWRIDASGRAELWTSIADAVFLNGATLHPHGDRLLVAESVTGRILAIDLQTPGATTWMADDRLKPVTEGIPGANGVKFFGGHVHVSVTGSNLLLRGPLGGDGACLHLETWAENLRADDFSFAADGAAYIATHPANSVLRLGADGSRSTLAGPDAGAVGSTATAFGRATGDTQALYVTTTGGLWSPYQGAPQPAKLLRLDVGVMGESLLAD
jgi:sugar lactone lactonase YvrE